jgi:hypothetical protein
MTPAPDWWVALQGQFGALLQTPLEVRAGRFQAPAAQYEPALVDAFSPVVAGASGPAAVPPVARLVLYHEQVWMRRFVVLQAAYPRTARVLGAWTFNRQAALHLAACERFGPDLGAVADGFDQRLLGALSGAPAPEALTEVLAERPVPGELLRQAVTLDRAQTASFEAPAPTYWRPTPEARQSLMDCVPRLAPGFGLVRETWALATLPDTPLSNGAPVDLPAPLPVARHWVFFRTEHGSASVVVHPACARWLALARGITVGEALARVERDCRPEDRAALQAQVPGWLDQIIGLGWWVGPAARVNRT